MIFSVNTIIYENDILVYRVNYTCPESYIPQICPEKFHFLLKINYIAVFAPCGLLYELYNKFSYPGLGVPMDSVPCDPRWCSFHTLGVSLLP